MCARRTFNLATAIEIEESQRVRIKDNRVGNAATYGLHSNVSGFCCRSIMPTRSREVQAERLRTPTPILPAANPC
jgi:hypothetical protein